MSATKFSRSPLRDPSDRPGPPGHAPKVAAALVSDRDRHQAWIGTEQVRHFKPEGNNSVGVLAVARAPQISGLGRARYCHRLIRRHARNARSKIFPLEVNGRFETDAVEIGIEPFLRTRAAYVMEVH